MANIVLRSTSETRGARAAVVVVSYNSAPWLRGCVESLAREPQLEVVVVDNASTDPSIATIADLPAQIIPLERNIGFGAGCNVGWRAATAPYVLFLNPDAQLPPAKVLDLIAVMRRTSAGIVAPRIVDEFGRLEWSMRRFPLVRSIFGQAFFAHRVVKAAWADELIRDPARYELEGPCDWASGACLLIHRDTLERLGGFDESFFMYREDVDLCRRVWDLGRPVVYTPTVVCMHAGGRSAPRWRLSRILAESRIRYAQKHFGRGRAVAYRVGVVLSAATHVLAARGIRARAGHVLALTAAIGASQT